MMLKNILSKDEYVYLICTLNIIICSSGTYTLLMVNPLSASSFKGLMLGDGGGRGCDVAASTSTIPSHWAVATFRLYHRFMSSVSGYMYIAIFAFAYIAFAYRRLPELLYT